MKLETAFEKWDRVLQFGVSYKLLEALLSDLGMFPDEKDRSKFIQESGYYRESNQYSCSMSLQRFFDIVSDKYKIYTVSHPQTTESQFIDLFISTGASLLHSIGQWEYTHQIMRKEQARETSFMKDDKTMEIIRLAGSGIGKSIDQLEADLHTRGMSLSIIEKIYLLMAKRDRLALGVDELRGKQRE